MPLESTIGPVKLYSPASPGKPWRVSWCPPGMPRRVKDRKTKGEAQALAKEIRSQLKRGEIGLVHRASKEEAELLSLCRKLHDPRRVLEDALERQTNFKRVTIAECCSRYIDEYRERESAMTRSDAKSKAGVIRETLGERYLDSLTEREIEEWRDNTLKGSARYRNNVHAHLRHIYTRARVWGYVQKGHNPARDVASLKTPKLEPVVWTPDQLRASLEWYDASESQDAGHRILFLALGAFAGMRPSEIEGVVGERDGLDWNDIDFENRHIHIRKEVAGKLGEARYITFTEKSGSGLTNEIAEFMWSALSGWISPYTKTTGPVTIRKCQRLMSPELRNAGIIEGWPKDGNELETYLREQFDRALMEPGEDMFSALTKAEFQGRALTRDEMLGFANLAFAGGRHTVIHSISSVLAHLAENPASLDHLREEPQRVVHAAEEFFRYFMPLTHIGRVCPVDTEVHGVAVKADGRVSLNWASANFDRAVFNEPEKVKLDRKPNPHVSFGFGAHLCLGAPHARLIVRSLLTSLAEKVERITMLDSKRIIEREATYERATGYESLTVKLKSA